MTGLLKSVLGEVKRYCHQSGKWHAAVSGIKSEYISARINIVSHS